MTLTIREGEQCRQVREAFDLTYRNNLNMSDALRAMDERAEWGWAAALFRDFVHRVISARTPYNLGLCPLRGQDSAAEE